MNTLVEVGGATRPSIEESKRRWFHSSDMDLYVWVDDYDQPYAFELCYQKVTAELSFRWDTDTGFVHSVVGSSRGAGGHTASALLAASSDPDISHIRRVFSEAADQLPPAIKTLVSEAIDSYPKNPVAPGNRPTWWQVRARKGFKMPGDELVWLLALLVVLGVAHAFL